MLGVEEVSTKAQSVTNLLFHVQLVFDPEWRRLQERHEPARCDSYIRFENPLELEQWLVVEPYICEVAGGDAGRLEAVRDCRLREAGIALFAGKPLLLGGRDDFTVPQQAGGAIVIESRNPQDVRRHQDRLFRTWRYRPS